MKLLPWPPVALFAIIPAGLGMVTTLGSSIAGPKDGVRLRRTTGTPLTQHRARPHPGADRHSQEQHEQHGLRHTANAETNLQPLGGVWEATTFVRVRLHHAPTPPATAPDPVRPTVAPPNELAAAAAPPPTDFADRPRPRPRANRVR